MTDNETTEAWGWVLSHADTIERVCWRLFKHTPLSIEEARTEVSIDLVEHFGAFDPERGRPITWIWMRGLAVRRRMVRHGVRNSFHALPPVEHESGPGAFGSPGRTEARAELSLVLDRANPAQQQAAVSVLTSWEPERVRRVFGAQGKRDTVLRSLTRANA